MPFVCVCAHFQLRNLSLSVNSMAHSYVSNIQSSMLQKNKLQYIRHTHKHIHKHHLMVRARLFIRLADNGKITQCTDTSVILYTHSRLYAVSNNVISNCKRQNRQHIWDVRPNKNLDCVHSPANLFDQIWFFWDFSSVAQFLLGRCLLYIIFFQYLCLCRGLLLCLICMHVHYVWLCIQYT